MPRSARRCAASIAGTPSTLKRNVGTRPDIVGGPYRVTLRRQVREQVLAELALVVADRGHTAERLDVRDRGAETREQLVRERAGLELSADGRRGGRSRLVGPPRLCELAPDIRNAEVRAAELVRRADQHVAADLDDVDRFVRRVVNGVDPRDRARRSRQMCRCASRRRRSPSHSRRSQTRRHACDPSADARGRRSRRSDRRSRARRARPFPCRRRARPTAPHRHRDPAPSSRPRPRPQSPAPRRARSRSRASSCSYRTRSRRSCSRGTGRRLPSPGRESPRPHGRLRTGRPGCRMRDEARRRSLRPLRPGPAFLRERRRMRNRLRARRTGRAPPRRSRLLADQDAAQHSGIDVPAGDDADDLLRVGQPV